MYITRTPQTTNSPRAVQGAGYNQLATTLYTPAARQQSREQRHACAAALSALYSCGFLLCSCFFYRTLRSAELGVSAVVEWYMHAATSITTILLLLLLLLQCDFRGQPSVVDTSSPFFDTSFSISVNNIPLLYCCVPCVTRVCVRGIAESHAWSALNLFFRRQSSALFGRGLLRRRRPQQKTYRPTNITQHYLAESSRKPIETIQVISSNSSTLFPV